MADALEHGLLLLMDQPTQFNRKRALPQDPRARRRINPHSADLLRWPGRYRSTRGAARREGSRAAYTADNGSRWCDRGVAGECTRLRHPAFSDHLPGICDSITAMDAGLAPGVVLLGKYRIEAVLGRGGMGVVLRVTHLHLGEEHALKILPPEVAIVPESHARFLHEAQAASRLRGEHVTRVSDVGVLPSGAPYMVMEYLRGIDLAQLLVQRRVLPPGEAVDYILQACEALAEAHANGIIHRDIKPNNLFLAARPDGSPLLKVLDFGISKLSVGGAMTRTDVVMGTPGYMSPEQMKSSRNADPRSDIWSLGVVLYECVNGRRPFDAEDFTAIVLQVVNNEVAAMDPRVPRGLQSAVLRCLEKDRDRRFRAVAELAAALAPFARDARAAAITAERTLAMARPLAATQGGRERAGQLPSTTTLGGSAGAMQVPARRAVALGGAVAIAAAIGVAAIIAAVQTTPTAPLGPTKTASPATTAIDPPGSTGSAPPAPVDRPVAMDSTAPSRPAPEVPGPVAAAPDAAESPAPARPATPPAPSDEDRSAAANTVTARCQDLQAQKAWPQLTACAAELDHLGGADDARRFRDTAARETSNLAAAERAGAALRGGRLQEAEKLIHLIAADSVYRPALDAQLERAERPIIEGTHRRALAMAAAHDCDALRRFQAQQATTSSSSVAAAAAVTCSAKPTTVAPAREDAANAAHGVTAAQGSATTSSPPPCDTTNVNELMSQAARVYSEGQAQEALDLIENALDCSADERLYGLAGLYACVAHDVRKAKLYFAKVSRAARPNIEQRCQLEGMNLRAP